MILILFKRKDQVFLSAISEKNEFLREEFQALVHLKSIL